VYLPAASHGFSIFDDDDYVTQNRIVKGGLTWAGVKWAFTTWQASNWHPITWLSHMLDCELFGLNAGAHHSVNLLFHTANTVLLFGLWLRLTGALWSAAFVAALFAWHPLHVESVAWIAERKDVLSTFFALLALLTYVRAVTGDTCQVTRTNSTLSPVTCHLSLHYWLALFFFALGLMAKPMLVTLPLVMLLLDYWPMQRFNHSTIPRLVLEKWPFLVMVAASCIITFQAQHQGGMVASLEEMPPGYRFSNVLLAYNRYLFKIFWPVNLAVFYPLPKIMPAPAVLAAAAVLLAISAAVWFGRRGGPYGLVGWLWFLGTLVPVIGLVQIGRAAMADRYTYFPSIGLFIALTFAVRDRARRFQLPGAALTVAAVLVLGGCVVLTENQLRYWRNDASLFSHAIRVTRDNEPAHLCLGLAYEKEGRQADAVIEYRTALRLNPHRVKTYNSLALLLAGAGRTNEAMTELREALRLFPADAAAHDSCANLLADSGQTGEALAEFREAVRLDPKNATLRNNLGAMLVELGRFDEAMGHFAEAAQVNATDWRAPYLMGKALLKQGRDEEAVPYFRQALQLDPDNLEALLGLARVLAADENPKVRDGRAALALASRANNLAGGIQPAVLDVMAMASAELGNFDDAQVITRKALDLANAAKLKTPEQLQQRLHLYQNRQPWRESFQATNPAPKNFPPIGPR
jgi:protein O-mannosyl-transferase